MVIKNNWWKTTFSKEYFSLWDPSSSSSQTWTKKEIKLISDLHLKKGAKVLDIPCGQGRHSVELAKRGFRVTGVDYSLIALRVAKKWALQNKVSPIFIKQDMRFLKLNEQFDAIVMLGNSFGYFSDIDNKKIIKNISALLKPEGFFVIHLLNPIKMIKQFGEKNVFKISGGHMEIKDTSFDPLSFVRESEWTIVRNNKKKILNVKLRFYTLPEIRSLFSLYKLSIVDVYGSLDKKPYSAKSLVMIVIAKK